MILLLHRLMLLAVLKLMIATLVVMTLVICVVVIVVVNMAEFVVSNPAGLFGYFLRVLTVAGIPVASQNLLDQLATPLRITLPEFRIALQGEHQSPLDPALLTSRKR